METFIRSHHSTLTRSTHLPIISSTELLEFYVVKLTPDEGVLCVDTDLSVDIVDMDAPGMPADLSPLFLTRSTTLRFTPLPALSHGSMGSETSYTLIGRKPLVISGTAQCGVYNFHHIQHAVNGSVGFTMESDVAGLN